MSGGEKATDTKTHRPHRASLPGAEPCRWQPLGFQTGKPSPAVQSAAVRRELIGCWDTGADWMLLPTCSRKFWVFGSITAPLPGWSLVFRPCWVLHAPWSFWDTLRESWCLLALQGPCVPGRSDSWRWCGGDSCWATVATGGCSSFVLTFFPLLLLLGQTLIR